MRRGTWILIIALDVVVAISAATVNPVLVNEVAAVLVSDTIDPCVAAVIFPGIPDFQSVEFPRAAKRVEIISSRISRLWAVVLTA